MQNRIKERLRTLGIKQIDLAKKMNLSKMGMHQLVNSENLKIETYIKIAEAMGVPAWSLLLSDEEIHEVRGDGRYASNMFRCPVCAALLEVRPVAMRDGHIADADDDADD